MLLVALCVAGFLLGRIQNAARGKGATDPFTSLVRSVFQPISGPIRSMTEGTSDWSIGVFSGSKLVAENRRLEAQVVAAGAYLEQVEALQREIDGLRTMQSFGPVPGKTRVPASIIGFFGYENLVTLNVGSAQGVGVGCPVVAPQGLLGTVQSVEPKRCQVFLLSNPGLTIGAIDISRKPAPAGLFRTLGVSFQDPQAPVEIGDTIVTSGFSERIPRGIVIGKVILVEDSQELGTRRAVIDPAVSLGDVREVHVLR
ncbi:MAG: rod shape-determining protein MreC [Fimbriimonas sp.]